MIKFAKIVTAAGVALVAATCGVFGVALVKAVIPIFALTEGTRFQIYIQDPLLYTLGPLFCGYIAFRKTLRILRYRVPIARLQ